jgi:hypothetical protein
MWTMKTSYWKIPAPKIFLSLYRTIKTYKISYILTKFVLLYTMSYFCLTIFVKINMSNLIVQLLNVREVYHLLINSVFHKLVIYDFHSFYFFAHFSFWLTYKTFQIWKFYYNSFDTQNMISFELNAVFKNSAFVSIQEFQYNCI